MKYIAYPIQLEYVYKKPCFSTFCPVDYEDNEGRPILESRSTRFLVDTDELSKCPYIGSRKDSNKPMNKNAFSKFIDHRISIHKQLDEICMGIGGSSASKNPKIGNILDLYRVAFISYKLPVYWAIQYYNNLDRNLNVPGDVAALSKLAHGFTHLLLHIMRGDISAFNKHWTGKELIEYAEKKALFVGLKEVCAAPPMLSVQLIDRLINSSDMARTSYLEGTTNTSVQGIIKNGDLCNSMEIISFVYETIRCKLWRYLNQQNESLKNIHPIQRNAIPYGNIAYEISTSIDPTTNIEFQAVVMRMWATNIDTIDNLVESQIIEAKKMCRLLNSQNVDGQIIIQLWNTFFNITLQGLSAINVEYQNYFSLTNSNNIEEIDMEIFFGLSPFQIY